MKRYLITFSYDGTNYSGYQKQPKLKTVQGEIEKALKKINNNKVTELCASGRTDAKVHALNQKAHVDINVEITPEKLCMAINSLVPDDIFVKEAVVVDKEFHARYNVRAKEYHYKINMGEYDPIEKNYVLQYNKKLDVVAMERAIRHFEGEHDFTTFCCSEDLKENPVRRIIQTNLIRDPKNVNKLTFVFLGTGFMKYMVRNMVGVLIEIGEGKRESEDIIVLLEAKDRRKAGKTAEPQGLYLRDVYY